MGLWPAEALTEKGGEVKDYFVKLGYNVTWDFKTITGERWWEIYKDNKEVAQIDMGVPLADIIEDICQMHQGKPGTSKSDYKICGHGPLLDELFKKVYETSHI